MYRRLYEPTATEVLYLYYTEQINFNLCTANSMNLPQLRFRRNLHEFEEIEFYLYLIIFIQFLATSRRKPRDNR